MKKSLVLLPLILTACGDSIPKITVSEFLANAPLLLEYHQKCSDDIGGIGQHPTCINAQEAYVKNEIRNARKKLAQ